MKAKVVLDRAVVGVSNSDCNGGRPNVSDISFLETRPASVRSLLLHSDACRRHFPYDSDIRCGARHVMHITCFLTPHPHPTLLLTRRSSTGLTFPRRIVRIKSGSNQQKDVPLFLWRIQQEVCVLKQDNKLIAFTFYITGSLSCCDLKPYFELDNKQTFLCHLRHDRWRSAAFNGWNRRIKKKDETVLCACQFSYSVIVCNCLRIKKLVSHKYHGWW